jgi:hypothetical protein
MRPLTIASMIGIGCAAVLHSIALFGRALGGEVPLLVLFPAMFVCFGSAVIRGVLRGLAEKKPTIDLAGFVPRWLKWCCFALIAYGFIFGFSAGKVSHHVGEELTSEKAAIFYGAMTSFFAMALFIHVGLSAKKTA